MFSRMPFGLRTVKGGGTCVVELPILIPGPGSKTPAKGRSEFVRDVAWDEFEIGVSWAMLFNTSAASIFWFSVMDL